MTERVRCAFLRWIEATTLPHSVFGPKQCPLLLLWANRVPTTEPLHMGKGLLACIVQKQFGSPTA